MLVRKIPIPPRAADRRSDAPMTVAEAERWPEPNHSRPPALAAVAAAAALHAVVLGLALTFVAVQPPPAPPEDQTVELVFAAPLAVPAPAAADASPAPEASPAPPPPDATPEPPPPPADVAPPPPAEAVAPPPEAQARAEPPPPPPSRPVLVEKPARPLKPPPVAHRPAVQAKPAPTPPARGETALAETARREQAPAATPAQPAAEAPVAADWQRALAAWLASHKTYPELARRRGQQGSVGLRFTADRSGRVLAVSLLQSAGSSVLDSAAEALVRDATLPPFPAVMTQQTTTVTVTIRYTLVD